MYINLHFGAHGLMGIWPRAILLHNLNNNNLYLGVISTSYQSKITYYMYECKWKLALSIYFIQVQHNVDVKNFIPFSYASK